MNSETKRSYHAAAGIHRIESAIEAALQRQSAALMPYYTLGYPDEETSIAVIEAISSYSDLVELGLPFSDPIADGSTIQKSTQASLANGVSIDGCLQMLARLRLKGMGTPTLLMGYFNPILAYGVEDFVLDAGGAGADGIIIPDLPLEEAHEVGNLAKRAGLAFIRFVSPTTKSYRIAEIAKGANGFVYAISVTGVTGARAALDGDLARLIASVKEVSAVPVAVGFGISSPEQAANVAQYADGIIVGSALIDAVGSATHDRPGAAARFVCALREALQKE